MIHNLPILIPHSKSSTYDAILLHAVADSVVRRRLGPAALSVTYRHQNLSILDHVITGVVQRSTYRVN